MIKFILVPMFVLPFLAALMLLSKGQTAGFLTWFGISIANAGIWLQTT